MRPLFTHDVLNSFMLWFDSFLMRKGDAYKTYTTKLYNYTDYRLGGGKVTYGSPYKQWVYDRSITGATFPSGVTINNVFTATGTSGMFIDYDNGRIIFNSGVSTSLNITGTYSVKEINVYTTHQPEEQLIIEGKYKTNSRFTVTGNYISPYQPVNPAAFCSLESSDNTPFAFGGEDCTSLNLKTVLFCENLYQLDGAMSIFADSFNEAFSKIPMTSHPLGEFGALKTGLYPTGYNYIDVNSQNNDEIFFISDVDVSKVRDSAVRELNPDTMIGIIDFEIKTFRYPRL